MQSKADLRVVAVAPALFSKAWEHAAPLVLEGLVAADMSLQETMDRVAEGNLQLWLIMNRLKLVACFFTEIIGKGGAKMVCICGLAGENPSAWGRLLTDHVEEFAKAEGARAVRFGGKRGWERLLPHYAVISRAGPVEIFERAVQ